MPPPEPEAPEEAPAALVRVRNLPVNEADEAPVQKSQVLKGFEIEKDRYVTFDPGEIAALRPPTSTELGIAEFVRLEEIDPVYFETSYYAAPDRGGEKPYALLVQALTETGYAAVGSLAMHGREHATVIRPGKHGLIAHTLFYQNEVRSAEEYRSDPALVSAKELDLAKTFVRALAAPFNPGKLKDTFEERLQALIHSRAGEAVDAYEHGKVTAAAPPAVDILEALRKSIEMARKPPEREKGTTGKPRQRRSRS
jgi:DNA end-binding protein Ku